VSINPAAVRATYKGVIMSKKELESALDWVGLDYLVRQTSDKEQTQVTINTSDISLLVDLLVAGAKEVL
jgi:hypothetical protein